MANPNDNRQHEGNRFNQNSVLDWAPGFSFQEALAQPLTQDKVFYQWRDQGRRLFLPYGLPGSSTTFSQPTEEQHYSQARDQSNPVSQSSEPTQTNPRGSGWSIEEDQKLCHAWMAISNDPITGSNQKKGSFWRRIFNHFVNQHKDTDPVVRNQKACEQRFTHIRGECNKWSAALKKIHDYPRSGANELDKERAAHSYFRDQNNGRLFKLGHCWEILQASAKFTAVHGPYTNNVPEFVNNVAHPRSFSDSPSAAEHIPNSTREVEGGQNLIESNLNDQISGDDLAHLTNSFGLQDSLQLELDNEESPTPTLGKRPPGRKASKEKSRARKQKSNESGVGERLVKSIDDLHASTTAEWQRVNQLNEEDQQWGIKYKKLQMIKEMIVIEYETNKLEKELDEEAPTIASSPAEKLKRIDARRKLLHELHAEAKVLAKACFPNGEEGSSRRISRNLSSSFDDEVNQ